MISHITEWRCDHCPAGHVERSTDLSVGCHIQQSDLPNGWNLVNGKLVCPLHYIAISPLDAKSKLHLAKDIYDGVHCTVPVPITDDLTPERWRESRGDK